MRAKRIITAVLIVMFAFAGFAACRVDEGGLKQIDPGELPAKREGVDYSPLKRYDQTVKLTALPVMHELDNGVPSNTTPFNQSFLKIAKDVLNIEIEFLGTGISPTNYDTQLNLFIASNKEPDIFFTTMPTVFRNLVEAKKLADLGDSFHYLLPRLQEMYLDEFPEILKSVMEEGQLWALPQPGNRYNNAQRLYVRKDWLEKANLQSYIDKAETESGWTVDDLITVGEAFKNSNYGGIKTVPLAMHKDIMWAASFGTLPLFQMYGSSPGSYFMGSDGKLHDSTIDGRTKQALQTMNTMYSKGIIDREFVSKDTQMVTNDIEAGYVGMVFGTWWTPEWPLGSTVSKVAGADWIPVEIPDGIPGEKALPVVKRVQNEGYNLISSKCSNPEAAVKLINLFYECYYSDDAVERFGNGVLKENGFFHNFVPIKLWDGNASLDEYYRVSKAFFEDGSSENLKQREKDLHWAKGWPYFTDPTNNRDGWGIFNCMIAPNSGYAYVAELSASDEAIFDEFYGSGLPAQQVYGDYLTSFAQTTFCKIIMGQSPVSAFDSFVTEYKNNGGNALLEQVNEWYSYQPKVN